MTTQNSPRIGVWLFVVIVSIFALQLLTKKDASLKIPGASRGDLTLEKDALPDEIGEWRCTGFHAALPPEQLPDGQFWWTHSWLYQRPGMSAYVAFDQADWDGWHELTICYQASGWTLAERAVVNVNTLEWPVVVAKLTKITGEKATLVFSLFDQNGQPLPSPFTGIPPRKIDPADRTFLKGLTGRLADQPQVNPDQPQRRDAGAKVMQCQCLLHHRDDLSDESLQQLISLHHESCARFRSAWKNRQNTHQKTAINGSAI